MHCLFHALPDPCTACSKHCLFHALPVSLPVPCTACSTACSMHCLFICLFHALPAPCTACSTACSMHCLFYVLLVPFTACSTACSMRCLLHCLFHALPVPLPFPFPCSSACSIACPCASSSDLPSTCLLVYDFVFGLLFANSSPSPFVSHSFCPTLCWSQYLSLCLSLSLSLGTSNYFQTPKHRLNMEFRYPKFILAPCHHVHSSPHWLLRPRCPPVPPHIRGRYWSARIDDISL
jgi:hypothetical protein